MKQFLNYKPPIFWKDKEIVKNNLNHGLYLKIKKLINEI